MLTSACLKAKTPASLTVGNALVESLKELLKKSKPQEWRYPKDSKYRNQNKHLAWLTWTLNKVEIALRKQKQEYGWLREWREQSGHVKVAT